MKYMHRPVSLWTILAVLLISLSMSGCSNRNQKQREINVFAAISLTDALTEIGDQFTEDEQIKVYFNFGASTTLQRQVEKGASADLFISASSQQIDDLNKLDLLEDNSRSDILANNLVIVSDIKSDIQLDTINQLHNPTISRVAIGQPEIVPAGTYAKEALLYYDLWAKLKPKLILGIDVRATLAYVAAGNVDLAIVYETDTTLNDNVKVVYKIPSKAHTPIVYPAVILRSSKQKQIAHRFVNYLKTSRAMTIFEKHGFTSLSPKTVPETSQ